MSVLSLAWGILSLVGMLVALLPCLGSLNWLNIPFSGMGLIISIIALNSAKEEDKGRVTTGLVLCAIAVALGTIRLILGGGLL
jgi:hypothetical protein